LGVRPTPNEVTVVVFDVNVYLDVARLTGPPFTWEAFKQVAEHARLHSESAKLHLGSECRKTTRFPA
jgi:hypothetical protein